jgi:hypothetical protein
MNETDRLNLKRMIGQSDCDDNTDAIRKLKHSKLIRADLNAFVKLKRNNRGADFEDVCRNKCSFLQTNYMDIFNRLIKDELDLKIFDRLLDALEKIEDGKVDQHEGSVVVGTILKELYIDSALKHGNNKSDADADAVPVYAESKTISWKQFKVLNGST